MFESAELKAGLKLNLMVNSCPKNITLSVGDVVRNLKYIDYETGVEQTISGRVKDIVVVDTKAKNTNNNINGILSKPSCPFYRNITNINCFDYAEGIASTASNAKAINTIESTETIVYAAKDSYGVRLSTSDPAHSDCAARDYYTNTPNIDISYPSANPLNVNKEGIYPDLPHLVSPAKGSSNDASGVEVSINDLFKDRYVAKYIKIDASTEFNCNIVKVMIKYIVDIETLDHSSCDCC